MSSCLGWGIVMLIMTTVAVTLMAGAWGLMWGIFGTVLLLVCAWMFGDGG